MKLLSSKKRKENISQFCLTKKIKIFLLEKSCVEKYMNDFYEKKREENISQYFKKNR